ncbi:hypothetical protein MBLNU230_g4496t1 [Neophaeotheca triangularis]
MRSRCSQQLGAAYQRTQQSSLLRLRPGPPNRSSHAHQQQRHYATPAETQSPNLSRKAEARYNEIGVQQLSSYIHPQLFHKPQASSQPDQKLIDLSKDHLKQHDLLGKTSDNAQPIAFDLPDLQGASLDEHFHRLGMDSAEPYLSMSKRYARASPPPKPRRWARQSGWTKYYADGTWEAIAAPDAEVLTFDTEVMWHETSFAAMACAASATHWYAWLSPWLLGESENDRHLIPLGDRTKPRIVVGHNIGYDRARIAEEYDLTQSRNFFMDTMSLHVAVNGMCSRQRPTWTKARKQRDLEDEIANADSNEDLASLLQAKGSGNGSQEEELWVGRSSANSLRDVAHFHCGVVIDKARREYFGELDRDGVNEKLDELLDYCAADVDITHKVYKKVFPLFLETCPHPVSFAALRHLSSEILPVNQKWQEYIQSAEETYQRLSSAVTARLVDLAERALEHKDEPQIYLNDPWLSQLDWSGQEVRMIKAKKKSDPPRPAARQKKPGMPNWYKGLFATNDSDMALTVRTRIAPLLLRLAWNGHPLVWTDTYGFAFRVPAAEKAKYMKMSMTICDMSKEEKNPRMQFDYQHVFVKLPHANGPTARCTNPLAKGYLQFFESGALGSEYAYAKEALEMNASCSYWISARDRIMSQMVVLENEKATADPNSNIGYILPQIIPMGTITRRAVENTWLTASNAKKNRVGSELKSMITAPPGHVFVGADVDSQELWIASLVGDAAFKLHGGNALGFMTLEGSKALGTDLHSRTASILGIGRGDAKIFNYGRIYGAGLAFAKSLLQRFNPTLSENAAQQTANELYLSTKGKKQRSKYLRDRPFWRGGTESLVFNALEDFAEQEKPHTPVLGAGITEALMRRYISKGGFMPSRINWAIQSSGVDYLHLLIVSMDYLSRRYNIAARLSLTVHDEIRYLSTEHDRHRTAMALQIANLWTRAMFAEQMGIPDLPQSCAFFSAVDIDHVLRKEVDMDCVTPSHPHSIPPGTSLDIEQLLSKGLASALDPAIQPIDPPKPERFDYQPRKPVMESLRNSNPDVPDVTYLRAQIARSQQDFNAVAKLVKPTPPPDPSAGTKRLPRWNAAPPGGPDFSQFNDYVSPSLTMDDLIESSGHDLGRDSVSEDTGRNLDQSDVPQPPAAPRQLGSSHKTSAKPQLRDRAANASFSTSSSASRHHHHHPHHPPHRRSVKPVYADEEVFFGEGLGGRKETARFGQSHSRDGSSGWGNTVDMGITPGETDEGWRRVGRGGWGRVVA